MKRGRARSARRSFSGDGCLDEPLIKSGGRRAAVLVHVRPYGQFSAAGTKPFSWLKRRNRFEKSVWIVYKSKKPLGGVAQLVRAPACHAGGREFKSRHSRHLNKVALT
jgi:hypothetical protein